MPTATVRYGRPKGSGLDDHKQLESIAALLAANPKLKPTTAIRSLGVSDPSAIRRLRDKFRIQQAKLMADARRSARSSTGIVATVACNENASAPAAARPNPISKTRCKNSTEAPSVSMIALAGFCDFGLHALSTTVRTQCVVAQYWLSLPPVSAAVRGQLVLNSIVIAAATRKKFRPHVLH